MDLNLAINQKEPVGVLNVPYFLGDGTNNHAGETGTSSKEAIFESDNHIYERIKGLVTQNPVYLTEPSLKRLCKNVCSNGEHTIYVGTGLCNASQISYKVPFDEMLMIVAAETLRRITGARSVVHHIANNHALTNAFEPSLVKKALNNHKETLHRIVNFCNFNHYHVITSDDFQSAPQYKEIHQEICHTINYQEHPYVVLELTDVTYFKKELKTEIKTGWIISSNPEETYFDEWMFDSKYIRYLGQNISFVYTIPGRTLDHMRIKAAPYIDVNNTKRIMFNVREDVRKKFVHAREERVNEEVVNGVKKILKLILRALKNLDVEVPRGSVEESATSLICDIMEGHNGIPTIE